MPRPNKNETRSDFIDRCMDDKTLLAEFPETNKRIAAIIGRWDDRIKENAEMNITSLIHNMSQIVDIRMMDGKQYYVAPTIMIVEGVLNNRYYSSEQIAVRPQQWDGRPVIVEHSTDYMGRPKSANDPNEMEKRTVGWLFNTRYEDGKLKSEAWIDPEKCSKVEHGPEILRKLENSEPIEVSTGVWTTDIQQNGEFNGVEYEAVATNLGADHLALLPYEKGACSWNDGAGMPRLNKRKEEMKDKKSLFSVFMEKFGFRGNSVGVRELENDLLEQLRSVHGKGPHETYIWVHDIFPENNRVVFELEREGKSTLYSQTYEIEKERAILNNEDPEQVYMKREYVPVENKQQKTQGDGNMKRKEIIDEMIGNSEHFEESDRENLEKMDQSAFDKIQKLHENSKSLIGKLAEAKKSEEKLEEKPKEKTPVENKDEKGEDKTIRFNSQEEFLAALPDGEFKQEMEEAIEMRANQHKHLVDELNKNERNEFTEDELKAMPLKQLKRLASLAKVPVYNGVQGGERPKTNESKSPKTMAINWANKGEIETVEQE